MNFSTFSVGGCWGQPMSFFWKLVDETQMSNPPEPAMHHYQFKFLVLLPLRAIYFYSLWYETPCICWVVESMGRSSHQKLSQFIYFLLYNFTKIKVLSQNQQPTVLFFIYQSNTWPIRHLANEIMDSNLSSRFWLGS